MTTEHEALDDIWTPLPTSAEYADLRRRLLQAEQDRDHWKANHDNQVEMKRRVSERLGESIRARAQVDEDVRRLVEAAAPFANISSCYCEDYWQDYGMPHGPNCVVDDLSPDIFALRAALEPFKAVGATEESPKGGEG